VKQHQQGVKTYVTVLVGSRDKIDFENLTKYGEVKELSLDELLGYENTIYVESR